MMAILAAESTFAAPCEMNPKTPAQRVVAKIDAQHDWAGFPKIESVPALDLEGGISAEVWNEANGALLVRTVEPGEDFWIYTRYCFDSDGSLVYLGFEVRTAWSWGYSADGPVKGKQFQPSIERFFEPQKEKSIPRPQEADDISGALKPTIYPKVIQLPFFKLLKKHK